MNIQEFETALQGRILAPKKVVSFSTMFFQKEYTPEDFVKIMNAGSNSVYFVDKQQQGAGIYKYSVNTLTGGYISTAVSDMQTSAKKQITLFSAVRMWFEGGMRV